MKFKGVDLTPLMGIGGWAIDVIEKAIPDRVAYTLVENYKAWFLWDFYPTAFLGPHIIVINLFPEERLNPELAQEVIIRPWVEARFERFVLSMIWWFRLWETLEAKNLEELVRGIVEDYRVEKQMEIKIPLLWHYQGESLDKGLYTFFTYETAEGEPLKPVRLDKVLMAMGEPLKEAPPEIKKEKWDWKTFVLIGEKGKETDGHRTLPMPAFIGNVLSVDEAPRVREILLGDIATLTEENPQYLKGVELLLMGTKWHGRLLELKEEIGMVKV